ncbi:hypothetical protein P175DRAFT_0534719 [Aspergillus ochraceoroseus IBT 24754]|uniref:Uncharacterized protein n=1 Tax=Aspergillus ochraceoroseus IBT 24754 TaxID=1392256 RepID=A0A2T5LRN1_9EURO|nr:uncharacterized protein P175DRAFT_0534719 [Aspergillus ochraceoroseus IBT 24754]PTU18936.1 hypothetical protein P175DRAFT_0534719 [Aspergillus ochraceoroseus IBT 24754]
MRSITMGPSVPEPLSILHTRQQINETIPVHYWNQDEQYEVYQTSTRSPQSYRCMIKSMKRSYSSHRSRCYKTSQSTFSSSTRDVSDLPSLSLNKVNTVDRRAEERTPIHMHQTDQSSSTKTELQGELSLWAYPATPISLPANPNTQLIYPILRTSSGIARVTEFQCTLAMIGLASNLTTAH